MSDAEFLEPLINAIPPGAKQITLSPEQFTRLHTLAGFHSMTAQRPRARRVSTVRGHVRKATKLLVARVAAKLNPPSTAPDDWPAYAALRNAAWRRTP